MPQLAYDSSLGGVAISLRTEFIAPPINSETAVR
jgi:hypothetical protein